MHPDAYPRGDLAVRARPHRDPGRHRLELLLALAIVAALFWLPTAWGIAAVSAALVVEIGEAAFWIWLSRRRKPAIGAEALAGADGVAVTDCRPQGRVRVAGEVWRAVCPDGADAGDDIVVQRVEGDLTLLVSRK